jgi:excisionase family DNA binding protein
VKGDTTTTECELVSVAEAARRLGVSEEYVRDCIAAGLLASVDVPQDPGRRLIAGPSVHELGARKGTRLLRRGDAGADTSGTPRV